MITIESEPQELAENSNEYENCVFCGAETIYWHRESNRPVCPACADVRSVAELPEAPFNY